MDKKDNCWFFSLPPKQFALLSALIGIILIDGLDSDQQNSLGNFLVSVGQVILVSAAQSALQGNGGKTDYNYGQTETN